MEVDIVSPPAGGAAVAGACRLADRAPPAAFPRSLKNPGAN